jgi:hypothetical protein
LQLGIGVEFDTIVTVKFAYLLRRIHTIVGNLLILGAAEALSAAESGHFLQ